MTGMSLFDRVIKDLQNCHSSWVQKDEKVWRDAVDAGLVEPWEEDDEVFFRLTEAGKEIVFAGGSVAGATLPGVRLN